MLYIYVKVGLEKKHQGAMSLKACLTTLLVLPTLLPPPASVDVCRSLHLGVAVLQYSLKVTSRPILL